ncbi:glycoside hydrolase family 1 protein [Amycolatopsis nigrescens]|uniref:glycoside hydrolase family 1 protein n=1 Tax=Amycolatopsis nigrescens TaxID=381445 RepID=UPI00036CDA51|nr:family 1 glycosylhydrolase [Amycolatopsis nigrescens]
MILRVLAVAALVALLLPASGGAAAAESWPRSFYWGVASSGYQSEGSAPDSNWSRYAGTGETDPYRDSADFLHRYPEDIRLAKEMGVNTFRFSVEWARVQPKPGVWDAAGLAFYDDVLRQVKAAGMTPMITLNHWVHPGWVADRGGWTADETVTDWLAFAELIVQRYQGSNALWVTINEPLVFVERELKIGAIGPLEVPGMLSRLVSAHRQAYDLIHRADPAAKVTSNQAFLSGFNGFSDLFFLNRVQDKLDFIGLDYYYGLSLDNFTIIDAATAQFWKVKLQPEGIYYALRSYAKQFPELPLYVVENGMPTDNGKPREDGYTRAQSLRDTVFWLQRAKADGINVIGYNYWSLADNYEWGSYRPRFGLYTVDVLTDPTLTRRPTDAVPAYRELITAGGVPDGYRLVAPPGFCSLVTPLDSCLDPAPPAGPRVPLR